MDEGRFDFEYKDNLKQNLIFNYDFISVQFQIKLYLCARIKRSRLF